MNCPSPLTSALSHNYIAPPQQFLTLQKNAEVWVARNAEAQYKWLKATYYYSENTEGVVENNRLLLKGMWLLLCLVGIAPSCGGCYGVVEITGLAKSEWT